MRIAAAVFAGILTASVIPSTAADFHARPQSIEQPAPAIDLKAALSRFLALQEIRATFDVVGKDQVAEAAADQLSLWQRSAPSAGELAELDRQLLAEASYYLVGLRYLVDVGGAAFPDDKPELLYRNDTLVQIDALERRLASAIDAGDDPAAILTDAEAIRALTEGYNFVPEDMAVFAHHDATLEEIWDRATRGTQT